MIANMICQMKDGGLIKSRSTMIIRKKVKWHSHYGHHTRDMIQEAHQKNKESLEQEVSSRADLPTFHSFLVNDIMIHLVTKPA